MSGLPIINIAAPDAAAALGRALEEIGFAYIAGHGVPQATIDSAFAASRAFHASSLAQKRSLAINDWHRGYMGMATSTVVTSSVARVTRPNLSESLMIMHEPAEDEIGQPLQGPNQWPGWLPEFRPAIEEYREGAERVSRAVIRLIAVALGLPETALDRHFARPTSFLRLLHYPPHPVDASEDQFGAAPHTDYGIITLLAQDDSGGLQVRRRDAGGDDGWIDAEPLPGTFVLNVADMLARWTNDRFVSTPEGTAHCQALGVNPAIAMRGTPYPLGAAARHSPCAEIAVFRIREDSDRLVTIAERVVLKHLGLIA